jgi:hypothetical protein
MTENLMSKSKPNIIPITSDDFYRFHPEFCFWLKERKDLYLDKLKDKKEVFKYFKKFVTRYNNGELRGERFYSGKMEYNAEIHSSYKWEKNHS